MSSTFLAHLILTYPRSTSYIALPAEPISTILSNLPLRDLFSLSQGNHSARLDVTKEYRDRFFRLIRPYALSTSVFAIMLRNTGSVISGSTAYHFMFPYPEHSLVHARAHYLTLLIKRDSLVSVMEHLCQSQGYLIVDGPYQSFPHDNPDPHGTELANANGYLSLNIVERDGIKIHIIASASNETPLIPLFHEHSSIAMNYLTPNTFTSFYPNLSLNNKGLINHLAYNDVQVLQDIFILKDTVVTDLEMYTSYRAILSEDPLILFNNHLSQCPRRHWCRLRRDTSDNLVLQFSFGQLIDITNTPDYLKPVITWTLGGYKCGRRISNGVYETIVIKEI